MSNRYYRFVVILTIYNGKSDIVVVFFWHQLNSTAEKTHPRITTDQQTRKVETITNTKFSLKTVTLLYIITETVRFNYIHSSRRQVPREIQRLDKRFPSLNFRHSLESKGCLKFRLKDFSG